MHVLQGDSSDLGRARLCVELGRVLPFMIMIICFVLAVDSPQAASISFLPSDSVVAIGDTATIALTLGGNGEQLQALHAVIHFRGEILDCINIRAGNMVVESGYQVALFKEFYADSVVVDLVLLGGQVLLGQPSDLVVLDFRGLQVGWSTLLHGNSVLKDPDGFSISAQLENGYLGCGVVSGVGSSSSVTNRPKGIRAFPNPSDPGRATTFSVESIRSGDYTEKALASENQLTIYDVAGHRIATIRMSFEGQDLVGQWNGIEASGVRAGAGIYFASFTVKGEYTSTKFILCR